MNCVCPPTAMRTVLGCEGREHPAVASDKKKPQRHNDTKELLSKHRFINVLPPNEPTFQPRYSEFHHNHHDTQNKHTCVHARGVEVTLCLTDDPTQALCCGEILTNNGTHKSKSDRCVKT